MSAISEQEQKSEVVEEQHKLHSTWTVWGHALKDNNWEIESYKKLYEFDSIEDFWKFFNNVKDFSSFMLFIMRGSILPIYEDEENKKGGSYQYVVPTKSSHHSIVQLVCRIIGETLTDVELYDEINGMSVVPKGGSSVINIWTKNSDQKLIFNNLKDRFFDPGHLRYKKWKPNN